jgi:hypothetical protein
MMPRRHELFITRTALIQAGSSPDVASGDVTAHPAGGMWPARHGDALMHIIRGEQPRRAQQPGEIYDY